MTKKYRTSTAWAPCHDCGKFDEDVKPRQLPKEPFISMCDDCYDHALFCIHELNDYDKEDF